MSGKDLPCDDTALCELEEGIEQAGGEYKGSATYDYPSVLL